MRDKVLRANVWLGLAGLAGASVLLAAGWPFMKTWFYSFAWWSFVLFLDGVNLRATGTSPLASSGRDFWAAAFLSIPVWLVFEMANLRLRNWSYHGLPSSTVERWLGYAVAYATVIPALLELGHFFGHAFERNRSEGRRVRVGPGGRRVLAVLGVASLVLPLVWPRVFFPLIWLGFLFLLEPANERGGGPSFLRDLGQGRWGRLTGWMAAGLAAGILWEFWNWWAGAHWRYHIPYLNFGRIFQMPVFGYGGFVPFALEVFALSSFLFLLRKRLRRRRGAVAAAAAALLAFDLLAFRLIVLFSVRF